ncbi:MAG: DUF87 domain-containing protein [Deltaproteobacteria bacterium]|nr:DUF87 domain-containing protein [Deltaproteobacteria bacterium]
MPRMADTLGVLSREVAEQGIAGLLETAVHAEGLRFVRGARVLPNEVGVVPEVKRFRLQEFFALNPPVVVVPAAGPVVLGALRVGMVEGLKSWREMAVVWAELAGVGCCIGLELVVRSGMVAVSVLAPSSVQETVAAVIGARLGVTVGQGADAFAGELPGKLVVLEAVARGTYADNVDVDGAGFAGLVIEACRRLEPVEVGFLQVLAAPAPGLLRDNVLSLLEGEAKVRLLRDPHVAPPEAAVRRAVMKVAAPLFVAVVRVGAFVSSARRARDVRRVLSGVIGTVRQGVHAWTVVPPSRFERVLGASGVRRMVIERRVHRAGTLVLNAIELARLGHVPEASTLERGVVVVSGRRPVAGRGVRVGVAVDGVPVVIPLPQLARGLGVIGRPGAGKTVLLSRLATELVREGCGVVVLDPHGDLRLIEFLSASVVDRVVVIDPSVQGRAASWNPVSVAGWDSPSRKASAITDAVAAVAGSAFGGVMEGLLAAAARAVVALPDGCFADLATMVSHSVAGEALRMRALRHVPGEGEAARFLRGFARTYAPPVVRPVVTLLARCLRNELIAPLLHARMPGRIDLRQCMDAGRIVVCRLPVGVLGADAVALLGTLLLHEVLGAALSRISLHPGERRLCGLIVDEAHRFVPRTATGTALDMPLREGRKFGLAVCVADQTLVGAPEGLVAAMELCGTSVYCSLAAGDAARVGRALHVPPAVLSSSPVGTALMRTDEGVMRVRITMPEQAADADAGAWDRAVEAWSRPRESVAAMVAEQEVDDEF